MPTLSEARPLISLCEPLLAGREWDYVKSCLDSGWVSSVGSFVDRFEREMAAYVGVRFGIATASGTAALHVALLAAGVRPDDEVLVSDLTFIAPANAIRYANAHPIFIDAEPRSWQMDAGKAVAFLEDGCEWKNGGLCNRKTGRRVRAVLPVHLLGHPVDFDPILEAANRYGLPVIEDATESLGAKYRGRAVGHLGAAACLSFNGNKTITTGGGGMILTDDALLAEKARYLSTQAKDDPIEYMHHEIGYNYRLTNLQAALGCAQLENLDRYLTKKRQIARRYTEALSGIQGLSFQEEAPHVSSAWWLSTIRLKNPCVSSRELLQILRTERIQARPLWQPMHESRAHAQDRPNYPLPVAEMLNRECLSLPSSVGLTEADQARVIDAIHAALFAHGSHQPLAFSRKSSQ